MEPKCPQTCRERLTDTEKVKCCLRRHLLPGPDGRPNGTTCEDLSEITFWCDVRASYIFVCTAKFIGVQTITLILIFIVFTSNFPTFLPQQWFCITDRGTNLVSVFLHGFYCCRSELMWGIQTAAGCFFDP